MIPATISLGYVPVKITVHLTRHANFVQTLTTSDGSNFPAGAAVTLTLGTTQWAATVTGPTVAWNVAAADVDALYDLLTGGQPGAHVAYSDGSGNEVVWMAGQVQWHV